VARLKLLLNDIRDVFARRRNAPIPSAELVKALVAIEGRPWSSAANPLTQRKLAKMLARMRIRPGRVGAACLGGYRRAQFKAANKKFAAANRRYQRVMISN
jgi:hypothetical protein